MKRVLLGLAVLLIVFGIIAPFLFDATPVVSIDGVEVYISGPHKFALMDDDERKNCFEGKSRVNVTLTNLSSETKWVGLQIAPRKDGDEYPSHVVLKPGGSYGIPAMPDGRWVLWVWPETWADPMGG
jgi:hypothetical protein